MIRRTQYITERVEQEEEEAPGVGLGMTISLVLVVALLLVTSGCLLIICHMKKG